MKVPSRRLKVLCLDPEFVIDVLSGLRRTVGNLWLPSWPTLPDDVQILNVAYDDWNRRFKVLLHSESFDEVPDGEQSPMLCGLDVNIEVLPFKEIADRALRSDVVRLQAEFEALKKECMFDEKTPTVEECPYCGGRHAGPNKYKRGFDCMVRQYAKKVNQVVELKEGLRKSSGKEDQVEPSIVVAD